MIQREKYLLQIRPFFDDDLIKIITGIRRCGKSVVLRQIRDEIKARSDNIIFLDFEDAAVLRQIPDADALLQYVAGTRKEGKCYLFLDEIQRVKDWPAACRTLRLNNASVFISGSNSKLLSKEFTKELSGRYAAFQIRPFIYKEIVQYCKELGYEPKITDYLILGGFPKRFEYRTTEAQKIYLNDLVETIIINDLENRYKIRKTDLFRKLVNYIFVSNARIFSVRSIQKYLEGTGLSCSITTLTKFLGYLNEAYAVETIRQYCTKTKRELAFFQKIYDIDVAFNSLLCSTGRFDLSQNLENVVYNELIYRGYDLQVFDNNGREIDFLARKNGREYYVQVAYSVEDNKAYAREFGAFKNLDNLHKKILITNDEIDYSTSTVEHIRLSDFLLCDEL